MKALIKRAAAKVETVARNPVVRPVEVWALRAILGYVAVKLGIDVKDLAQ